jgi:hypothetical protein
MIFSIGNIKSQPPTINGDQLEMVQTYKYLGLIINKNGSFTKTIDDRIAKTKRALYVLKQALSTSCNVSVPLAMSLFDKSIQPILLYGSPIWSVPSSHTHVKITMDNIPCKKTKQFISNALEPLSVYNENIILVRSYKSKHFVTIKLDNVVTKSKLLQNYNKTPVTFTISDHVTRSTSFETALYTQIFVNLL